MCDCNSEIQSPEHIFLRCPIFVIKTIKFLDSLNEIVVQGKEDSFFSLVLPGPDKFHKKFSETKLYDFVTSLKSTKTSPHP